MTRKRIRDIRNDELIEAAIRTIHARGYISVTMAEIAQAAGTSAASINYYFGTKEQLMEKTMRRLLSTLHNCVVKRLAQANTPQERLFAIVQANFDDPFLTIEQCSVWIQFWASAPYVPRLARLHRINQSRVTSNLRHELRQFLQPAQQEHVRASIQAYMDGTWIELVQSGKPIDAAKARQAACQVLTTLLEGADHSPRG